MPRYARPRGTASLDAAINAFSNFAKVAIIGYLIENGPSTAGEVSVALELEAPTVKRNLYLLTAEGVTVADPTASKDRNGRRVKYAVAEGEVARRYAELGVALGVLPGSE